MKDPIPQQPDENFDDKVENRKAAKKLLSTQYHDPVVAGYYELLSLPMAQFIDELSDYDESDDDDIRPY